MTSFTFIELFAGIGGFRIAFQSVGGTCVFASEWDKFAKQTYEANFGETPAGDITKEPIENIPDHDVLRAGFPCQPFSIAGVTKNNALGNAHGFNLGGSVALVILDSTYPIGSLCFSPLGQEASGWKNSFDGKPRTLRLGLEKRQLPNRVLVCVFHVKCS